MSSRYGRNKKRVHLARIEELERELIVSRRETSRILHDRLRVANRLRDLMSSIKALYPYSILLPVQKISRSAAEISMGWEQRDSDPSPDGRVRIIDPLDFDDLDQVPAMSAFLRRTFSVRMHQIQAWLGRGRSTLEKIIHVEVRDSQGLWRHTYSEQCMDRVNDLPRLQEHMANKILNAIMAEQQNPSKTP